MSLRWFADRVAARDVGLNIEVLDGAQLGGERDYIEGMMLGSIQMAQVSTAPVSGFIPEFDLFSLPYLIRDTDHFKNVVTGAGRRQVQRAGRRARPEDPGLVRQRLPQRVQQGSSRRHARGHGWLEDSA